MCFKEMSDGNQFTACLSGRFMTRKNICQMQILIFSDSCAVMRSVYYFEHTGSSKFADRTFQNVSLARSNFFYGQ